MPSTSSVTLPKKNCQSTSNSLKRSSNDKRQQKYNPKASYVDGGATSQTESDDTEKSSSSSSSSQKKRQHEHRRRQYKKRNSTQQNSPSVTMDMKRHQSNSAVNYAGPDFMNDAPSPSALPLPSNVKSKTTQHIKDSKSYMMDPISEIQEKLRMMLKIQV